MSKILNYYVADLIRKVQSHKILCKQEAKEVLLTILNRNSNSSDLLWTSLFSSIQTRGNDFNEIVGFIDAVREFDKSLISDKKINIDSNEPIVSITGSGKEFFKTFNVSTAAAVVSACCGVKVIKPGSIATSATSGAINILEELSIPIPNDIQEIKKCTEITGLCFIDFSYVAKKYAFRYDNKFYFFHPLSFILPPLAIPIHLDGLVYGIAHPNVKLSAELFDYYGFNNVAIVCGEIDNQKIDELSPFGDSYVAYLNNGEIIQEKYEFKNSINNYQSLNERHSHKENAKYFYNVLKGKAPIEAIELVSYNVGLILKIAGKVECIEDGSQIAKRVMLTGKAIEKLMQYKEYWEKSEIEFHQIGEGK